MDPDLDSNEAIRLYCGINEVKWNHHPVAPGPYACISPVYGKTVRTKTENAVAVPNKVSIIQDSGAFCDGPGERLSFPKALNRQVSHANKYGYQSRISHRATYDLLIDEVWIDGNRHKRRWTVDQADAAVLETITAAQFLTDSVHRRGLGLVASAQGVDAHQYLDCVKALAPLLDTQRDILGLGGWCIMGKMPKQMLPEFRRTISLVIPFAASVGIKWIHIWGVLFAPALGELLWLCDRCGIFLSTDSAGPSLRPAFGLWGYADWSDKSYVRPPVSTRGLERAKHVAATRAWLSGFRETRYYRKPPVNWLDQLSLL